MKKGDPRVAFLLPVAVDRKKKVKNQPPVIDMKRTTCGASICLVKSCP